MNEILINKNKDSYSLISLAVNILSDLGVKHEVIDKGDHYILKYGK